MSKCRLFFWCVLFILGLGGESLEAAPVLRPFMKETYPMEDTVTNNIDPNVLFLLDTGSPMSFRPKGKMPDSANYMPMSLTNQKALSNLFTNATYGVGGRPLSVNGVEQVSDKSGGFYGNTASEYSYSRYGRDLDTANNLIGDPNSYYSPYDDPAKTPYWPYFLTFKNTTYAKLAANAPASSFPALARPGMSVTNLTEVNRYVTSGWGGLVPNDSRMYQMKLVLWRLLSKENQQLLSRMKVGMATSYQEENYGANMWADFYKNDTYDRTTKPGVVRNINSVTYPYGSGPSWSNGLEAPYYTGAGDHYDFSQIVYAGVDRNYYTKSSPPTALEVLQWNQVNRSLLKIPFDYLYTLQSNGTYTETNNLSEFRRYIDGVEDVSALTSKAASNPELIADGKTPLATAIYGRDFHLTGKDSKNNPLIRYAAQTATISYGSSSRINLKSYTNSDSLRTGQAVGSVIDYFSPPASEPTKLDFTNNEGYFPVLGSCQSNWLVVFTAANDSDPDALTAEQAVQKLFMNTFQVRGRILNATTKKWQEVPALQMDSGVRTLVVGFVNPDSSDVASQPLRNTLTAMAQWGDPIFSGNTYIANPNAQPYFANDVPSLISSLKAILLRIYSDRYVGGAPTVLPQGTGLSIAGSLYSPSYKIQVFDQWQGWFTKYTLDANSDATLKWELNDGYLQKNTASRNLYTIAYKAGTAGTAVSTIDALASSTSAFTQLTGVPTANIADFTKWLRSYNGISILGDMEHAGFVVLGDAEAFTKIASRDTTIYLQTNRGFLHAVNDASGNEKWAFMPPNIFQGRAKAFKFTLDSSGAVVSGSWIQGDGSVKLNSKAMDLLDGNLIAENARIGGAYHTVLIGNLGWGGNGFYAMDVTASGTSPQFLWAVDNARYEAPVAGSVQLWGNAVSSSSTDYSDLGLTIVSTSVLSIDQKTGDSGKRDVGILPGGMGYTLGADSQGKVFYVFDPKDATILKKLDNSPSTFVDPTPTQKRDLGMMVAPVTYIKDPQTGTTTSFYTSDSNGNILYCNTEQEMANWQFKSIFQLVTSSDKPVSMSEALLVVDTQRGHRWIFSGTRDLMVPNYSSNRKMTNPAQYILALDTSKASGDVNTNTPGMVPLVYVQDDIESTYGKPLSSFVPVNSNSPDFKGWYLQLRPQTATTNAEYVTTAPYLYSDVLYVSTFVPKPQPIDATNKTLCPEMGDSKIYALNPLTGEGMWTNKKQAIVLRNIKISGMSAFGGKLYIGLKPFKYGALNNLPADIITAKRIGSEGNLLQFVPVNLPSPPPPPGNINVPYMQYWKEAF